MPTFETCMTFAIVAFLTVFGFFPLMALLVGHALAH
jgi:hypothetical protein